MLVACAQQVGSVMVELDFGRLRQRPDTIKVLVNRGVKGFITREPEALNMFSEGTYDPCIDREYPCACQFVP